LPLQITETTSGGKLRAMFGLAVNGLSPISLQVHHRYGEATVFCIKTVKPVFCDLKSKFPLKLKIKYQHFNVKGRPIDWYPFQSPEPIVFVILYLT
jgi:hypothetical protein